MKKKLMILVLACACVLTACGTEQTSNESNNPAPTKATETEDTEKTEGTSSESATAGTPEENSGSTEMAGNSGTEESAAVTVDFAAVLKELHNLNTYKEREAYVATLDKAQFGVTEMENMDLVTHANGTAIDVIYTFDMETGDYIKSEAPDSPMHYPSFDNHVLAGCANIDMYAEEGGEMPTGDVVLMTLTNLTTGETDPWGVKIYKAAMKVVETESEYGYYYEEYVIDPDSPVTAAFCTIEELVNSKNADMDLQYTHNKNVTRVEPVYVEELYDENWNPTGEYVVYEVYKEVRYAEESDLEVEEWGDETYYYYCDEDGNYWNVYQDENGKFYYNFEEVLEIPAKERGYTVVSNDNWGTYAVDKDGNVVMGSDEYVQEGSDPMITTWDTLKYYGDIYNPKFWQAFTSTVSFSGEYAVADMKAEDYPYLSAEEFDSLVKKYMDVMDITLDEEVLAIRASIPESWGYLYEDYFQKNGYISKSNYIEETDNYEVVKVIFDRKENWYINNGYQCEVAVRNDDITTEMPVHLVGYSFSNAEVKGVDEAKKFLAGILEYKTENDIFSCDVNGKPAYYAEEQYWSDERFIYVLQDIGLENYISIRITTCDMEIKTEELVKQFLLDGNYSVEQSVLQLDEE